MAVKIRFNKPAAIEQLCFQEPIGAETPQTFFSESGEWAESSTNHSHVLDSGKW